MVLADLFHDIFVKTQFLPQSKSFFKKISQMTNIKSTTYREILCIHVEKLWKKFVESLIYSAKHPWVKLTKLVLIISKKGNKILPAFVSAHLYLHEVWMLWNASLLVTCPIKLSVFCTCLRHVQSLCGFLIITEVVHKKT